VLFVGRRLDVLFMRGNRIDGDLVSFINGRIVFWLWLMD